MHLNVVKHFHQNIDSVKDRAKFDTMNMYEDKKIHVWNQNNIKSENYFKSSLTLQQKLIVEAQECDRLHFSTPPPKKNRWLSILSLIYKADVRSKWGLIGGN